VEPAKVLGNPDRMYISNLTQQLLRITEAHPMTKSGPLAIDPIKDLKINELDFIDMWTKKENLTQQVSASKCHKCPKLDVQLSLMGNKASLKNNISLLKHSVSEDSLALMPDFQARIQVLLTMGYIDDDRSVLLKGRVAREINTADELLATELIFENALDHLMPEEIVALLSAFVFQEKEAVEPNLTPNLEKARTNLKKIAVRVAEIQIACGAPLLVEEYVRTLKFGMMEVVYEWARQLPFSDICTLTEVPEGTIVRCITRLDETCKEIRNVARIIGNTALYTKIEEASKLIKRDIVFASSLYIIENK